MWFTSSYYLAHAHHKQSFFSPDNETINVVSIQTSEKKLGTPTIKAMPISIIHSNDLK